MRKVFKGLLALAAIAFAGAVAFVAFFDFDGAINAQKDKYLPEVEKVLGRKVTVGPVQTTFLPVLGAEVKDIVVQGPATAPADALLKLGDVVFQVDLWTALTSLGTNVRLKALVVRGLQLNVVREADGSLSFDDVVKRLAEGPPPEEKPKPLDPEARKFIENLQLQRVALEDAQVRFLDKATGGAPAETRIDKILVELNDVLLASPFDLHISAAIAANAPNFDLKTRIGPLPIGQENPPPPQVAFIKLKMADVNLASFAPYVPADAPVALATAQVSADLEVTDPLAKSGKITSKGTFAVKQIAFGLKQRGAPFDLTLTPNFTLDPKAGAVDLTGFSLALNDMKFLAGGRVTGLTEGKPAFDALTLKTENVDLGRVFEALPDAAAGLPKGATVKGPLALDATATGDATNQRVALALSLDGATIVLPGKFEKGPGTPLNTRFDAEIAAQKDLKLNSFHVALGDINLRLAGSVKDFAAPVIDLTGGTGKFDINGPSRLLPAVKAGMPPDVTVAGQAEIDLKVAGSAQNIDARVLVGLSGADLAVPGLTVRGSGQVEVTAKGSPSADISVNANLSLAGLELNTDGLKKAAGQPFDVRAGVTRAGSVVTLSDLLVNLGPLKLTGAGSVNQASKVVDLKAELARFDVSALSTMLPALAATPISKAQLGMQVAVSGNPDDPTTLKAEMKDFYFAMAGSSVAGDLSVENPTAPKIRFAFTSPLLDLDAMFPPTGEAPAADEGGAGEVPEIVKKLDVDGRINIAQGRAGGFPFSQFVAQLTMLGGKLTFNALDFNAYGGQFSAASTSVDIGHAKPRFDLKTSLKNVDIAPLLAEQADIKGTLSGRFSGDFAVKGEGSIWDDVAKNLSGAMGASIIDGRLSKLDLKRAILAPLAAKLPLIKAPTGPAGMALRNLAGQFEIADGKARLKQPMKLDTPDGPVTLDGYIGLDKALSMKGTFDVTPAMVAQASGGKLKLGKNAPVGLVLGGTVDEPEVSGIEVGDLVEALLRQSAAGQLIDAAKNAEALAREKAAEAEAMARQKVDAAKAEAQRRVDDAKKKADEAKKKAEAEAKKRADEAKKKAEEEAKKKAKNAIKGLF